MFAFAFWNLLIVVLFGLIALPGDVVTPAAVEPQAAGV